MHDNLPAVFITFEGVDGCGKSTQFRKAAIALKDIAEQPITSTREPGGTLVGESIRDILLGKENHLLPTTELLLFAAARSQLVNLVIVPALKRGHIVLCDRYMDSTLAYQGARPELRATDIQQSIEIATGGLMPNLTFLFDLPVELGLARRGKDTNRIEDESLEFHNLVRANYLALASSNPTRFVVIDATANIEKVHYNVIKVITNYLDGNLPNR